MLRNGSIQKLNGRVGKIIAKAHTKNPLTGHHHEMCIFKLHYNGYYYITPQEYFETATKDDRKLDPRNDTYWKNIHAAIVGKVYYTDEPCQWFNV
jgi:hypothetical protein